MATNYLATMTKTLTKTKTFKLTLERKEVETLLRSYIKKAARYEPILFQLQTNLAEISGAYVDPQDSRSIIGYCQEVDWMKRMKRHNQCVGKYSIPYLRGNYTKKFRNAFNYKLWLNEKAIEEFNVISDRVKEISELTGIEKLETMGNESYLKTKLHTIRIVTPRQKRSVEYYWKQKELGNTDYHYTHKYHC